MIVIPSAPFNSKSKAEHTLFRLLKSVFTDDGYYAFYSLLLQNHPSKRFAEIDFLLLTPHGIFVLEIKGGSVSCKDGIWRTVNASGESCEYKQSPFHQADTALQGLRQQLACHFGQAFVAPICLGYGVITPDCLLETTALGWDRAMLCNQRDARNLARWLDKFFAYWQVRNNQVLATKPLSFDKILAIKDYLCPDLEAAVTHESCFASDLLELLVSLTRLYPLAHITVVGEMSLLCKLQPLIASLHPTYFIGDGETGIDKLGLLPADQAQDFTNEVIVAPHEKGQQKSHCQCAKKLYLSVVFDDTH